MIYPHADDEIVAMGYANYNNRIQEEDGMVTIDPRAFRTYMFVNYIEKLNTQKENTWKGVLNATRTMKTTMTTIL